MAADLRTAIRQQALSLEFDAVGFAPARLGARHKAGLTDFLDQDFQGDMDWLAAKAARRAEPQALWPEAKSVIVLALHYRPDGDPLTLLQHTERGNISVYARGRDYHDVLKKRLKALGRWLAETYECQVKVFVDTAPVAEKPLAQQAAVGWQGKHSNLVSREHGSWLFLGEIFCDLALPSDEPEHDYCGSCRKCLDICPTDAFPKPYVLDARRCISYLTIEHKGHIAEEFRRPMGNRIFGCDDCLAVCPWNKFAAAAQHTALLPRLELTAPRLRDLAALDDAGFRSLFAGTPVKRLGRERFIRNVLIALGNSGEAANLEVVRPHLDDPSPLVRAMAVWALGQLGEPATQVAEKAERLDSEADAAVRREWEALP